MSKIKIDGDCWLWTGSNNGRGYGRIRFFGKCEQIHRVSWAMEHGCMPPKGYYVHHTCERKACFNPAHLELEDVFSHQSRHTKGRKMTWAKRAGEHHNAKLSNEDVALIRSIWLDAWNMYEVVPLTRKSKRASVCSLARSFGVSPGHIGEILKGTERPHG